MQSRTFLKTLVLALSLLTAQQLRAESQVTLAVELNPMGSFEATSSSLVGSVKKSGAKFVAQNVILDLTTLSSGIDLRDKHMKEEYFQVQKYPRAVLVKALGKDGRFVGMLKVRGVLRKVSGTYKISGDTVEAEFATRMSQYKIKKASYMGVGVEDTVKVKVKIPLG